MKKTIFSVLAVIAINLCNAQTGNVGIGTTTPGSKLTVNGSFAGNYKIATATGAVDPNDFYVSYNSAANGTLTLPAATAAAPAAGNTLGRIYHFKNTGTALLTIAASGSELLDNQSGAGVASITISPGFYAMLISKGTTSGTTWEVALLEGSNPSGIYEATGTTAVTIAAGATKDITGATTTFTTTAANSTLLITYGALGIPGAAGAPSQGTIDLWVDGAKLNSSYFACSDMGTLQRVGNYSTSQKIIQVAAGTHTIKLQAKCWYNSVVFNMDASGYSGATASDANAMKARISILVTN